MSLPDAVLPHAVLPHAVLLDFSGTLFFIETAEQAVAAALGPDFAALAPRLQSLGAINGSLASADLPAHLADVWERRDLSARAHRAAYSGLAVHAGLLPEQADVLYDRGIDPAAWSAYPDTLEVLERLRAAQVPVALVSNVGWDPRPVLRRYGALELIDVLVLSDERGVVKPDPAIFRQACAELGVAPADALMVGDNAVADAGAIGVGCRFVLVPAAPEEHGSDALLRAVGFKRSGRAPTGQNMR